MGASKYPTNEKLKLGHRLFVAGGDLEKFRFLFGDKVGRSMFALFTFDKLWPDFKILTKFLDGKLSFKNYSVETLESIVRRTRHAKIRLKKNDAAYLSESQVRKMFP